MGVRHELAVLCFFGLANVYLLRVNLNVAIVAMVSHVEQFSKSHVESCPQPESSLITRVLQEEKRSGEFEWTPYDQGIILGAFFYGYVVSNLIGGTLAERFGGKIVFGLGILITALLTLLTPVAARTSKSAIIILRVLEGLSEGVVFPALHTISGRWLPKSERGFLFSVLHTGTAFGTVLGFPIAGALSGSHFLGGWPAVFYIFGSLGVVWFGFWWKLMHEFPSEHPTISLEEKKYILKNLEHKSYEEVSHQTPWCKIFSSIPMWAVAISGLFHAWAFYTILTDLSSFLNNVLHFDVKTNGLISSLPHVANILVQCTGGYLVDLIIRREILGATATRKLFNFCAGTITGVCFLGTVFSGCNRTWVVICITTATGISGLLVPSLPIALLDMAPKHAGTLLGLTNGFGNIAGFAAPYVVGAVTNQNESLEQWHKVFYMAAAVSFLGAVIFSIFGTSELQPWANDTDAGEEERTPWIPEDGLLQSPVQNSIHETGT